ncbi:uncharacterized protein LOC121962501 [Plectropomus leopardus]|uniref:uncharacterized protein LOC121962501 n=1 Tax=Plectropomus leopardus TaxID=160734 RepID=UPI001C4C16A1|nr:uncharacterized protein LOC121962501 [Plectropomus leopardus]
MEVTALCSRRVINVLLLLAHVQDSYSRNAGSFYPRIAPSRLQFFEYESVFINCESFFYDSTQWRVMRNIKGINTLCYTNWETKGPCKITTAFSADSGEYWCETRGQKSHSVNITVTADSVVLDSPARPVIEGETVTLHCKNKKISNFTADFYKDGVLIRRHWTENMTIHSVSRSDEGLYKCLISEAGESAESWLAVRAHQEETSVLVSRPSGVLTLLWVTVSFLILALLLLVMFGLHYTKLKVQADYSTSPVIPVVHTETNEAEVQTATYTGITNLREARETRETEQQTATYSKIRNLRETRDEGGQSTAAIYYTLSMGKTNN